MKSVAYQSRNLVTTAFSLSISRPSRVEKRWLSPNGFSFKIVQPITVDPLPRIIPGHILKPPYANIDFSSKSRSLFPTWKEKTPRFPSIRTEEEITKVSFSIS